MRFTAALMTIVLIFYPSFVFADLNEPNKNIVLDTKKGVSMENSVFLHEELKKMVWPV